MNNSDKLIADFLKMKICVSISFSLDKAAVGAIWKSWPAEPGHKSLLNSKQQRKKSPQPGASWELSWRERAALFARLGWGKHSQVLAQRSTSCHSMRRAGQGRWSREMLQQERTLEIISSNCPLHLGLFLWLKTRER